MDAVVPYDDPLARFNCATIEEAKQIILMTEEEFGLLSSDQRWQKETAWLLPRLVIKAGPVLDFGCGIGRLAKHLVGPVCPVFGVDISSTMRAHAVEYVQSDHFKAGSVEDLDREIMTGYRAQTIIAAWILQHSCDLVNDIKRLSMVANKNTDLYLLNRFRRSVPAPNGEWFDDGQSIAPLLWVAGFRNIKAEIVPEELCFPGASLQRWIFRGV